MAEKNNETRDNDLYLT